MDGSVDDGAEIPSHIVEDLADASALLGVDPAAIEIRYIDDPQRSGKTDVPGGAIVMAPSAMVVIFRQSGERTLMLLNDEPSPSP